MMVRGCLGRAGKENEDGSKRDYPHRRRCPRRAGRRRDRIPQKKEDDLVLFCLLQKHS
jgi:hypothetical protein